MGYILLLAALLFIMYIGSRTDKFTLSSDVYIVEDYDNGWIAYAKTWDAISYFVVKWNENIDVHGEVTLYDFHDVYWKEHISSRDVTTIPMEDGYGYMLILPPVSDDLRYKKWKE